MKNMKKIIVIALVIVGLLTFYGMGSKKKAKGKAKTSPVSTNQKAAPDFSFIDVDGSEVKISDFKGKVVFLDFWATWCPPCRAEIPFFVELYEKYGKDGLVIIGAALDEEKKVKAFAKQYKMNYPTGAVERSVGNLYGGIRGIPTTFIIDREGNIVKSYTGFRPKNIFEKDFLELK